MHKKLEKLLVWEASKQTYNKQRMKVSLIFIVSIVCLTSGCGPNHGSGRLNDVLINEIKRNGGRAEIHEQLPNLTGRWTCQRDRFGSVFQTRDMQFEQIDQFFRRAYGAPNKAGETPEHQQQWVIPARAAGVSIWYLKLGDGVKISILKPLEVPGDATK